jgi:hypothetical protein
MEATVTVRGRSDEELADMHALDCFPPDERERVAGAIKEVLATGSKRSSKVCQSSLNQQKLEATTRVG